MSNRLSLGKKALVNALSYRWSDKFSFIFENDEGQIIKKTDKVFACIISSKVLNAFLGDPTITQLTFPLNDVNPKIIDNYFNKISDGLDNDPSKIYGYLKIAEAIGTEDIIEQILENYKDKNRINNTNIINKIILKIRTNASYDEEIKYAVKNISELIDERVFDECPSEYKVDILSEILTEYTKTSTNERELDKIYDFIDTFDNSDFFRLVCLLNPKRINGEFIGRALNRVNREDITENFLNFLQERFLTPKGKVASNTINCDYSNTCLHGIFAYLTEKSGGNPVDTNDVHITFPGVDQNVLKNVIEYDDKTSVGISVKAKSTDYTKLTFDFGDNKKVRLSGYDIKVRGEMSAYNFPKTWIIYGSNDKLILNRLDIQSNYDDFSPGKLKHFPIHQCKEGYRYIIYHQLQNQGNDNLQRYMRLASIEFYGDIIYN